MPAVLEVVVWGWRDVNVQRLLQGGASEGRKISGLANPLPRGRAVGVLMKLRGIAALFLGCLLVEETVLILPAMRSSSWMLELVR